MNIHAGCITLNPYAFIEMEDGEPPEPDWDQLISMLQATSDYLRGTDRDIDGSILITEACEHFLNMLTDNFENEDDRLRAFLRYVEWTAWWMAGMADDDALRERVWQLCEPSAGEIMAGIRQASIPN